MFSQIIHFKPTQTVILTSLNFSTKLLLRRFGIHFIGIQNKKENDDRINNKNESDKQKLERKNLQLAEEALRLKNANDDKARQVAEYNQRELEKTISEEARVKREDLERKALVKKKKADEKARLEAAGRKKEEKIRKAREVIEAKAEEKRAKLAAKSGKRRFGTKGVI